MIETMQESLQKLKEYVDEMIKIFEFTSLVAVQFNNNLWSGINL